MKSSNDNQIEQEEEEEESTHSLQFSPSPTSKHTTPQDQKRQLHEIQLFAQYAQGLGSDLHSMDLSQDTYTVEDSTLKDLNSYNDMLQQFSGWATGGSPDSLIGKDRLDEEEEEDEGEDILQQDLEQDEDLGQEEEEEDDEEEEELMTSMSSIVMDDQKPILLSPVRGSMEDIQRFAEMAMAMAPEGSGSFEEDDEEEQVEGGQAQEADSDSIRNDQEELAMKADEERRKHEMNLFRQFANSDGYATANFDSPHVDNSSPPSPIIDTNEQELRQQQEIHMFAQMANGDGYATAMMSTHDDKDTLIQQQEQDRQTKEMNLFSQMANDTTQNYFTANESSFANLNQDHPVGSMIFNSSTTKSKGTFVSDSTIANIPDKNDNLSAALAMFETEIPDELKSAKEESSHKNSSTVPSNQGDTVMNVFSSSTRVKPVYDEIYSEKILVQRPLFFGTVIPERIQKLVFEGREHILKSDKRTSDDDGHHLLSPHEDTAIDAKVEPKLNTRNIENVLEALGHVTLPSTGDTSTEMKLKSHMTLYEPVWGPDARLKREKRISELLKNQKDANSHLEDTSDNVEIPILNRTISSSNQSSIESIVTPDMSVGRKSLTSSSGDEKMSSPDTAENSFLKMARATSGGTFVGPEGTMVSISHSNMMNRGTFEKSELRKQIGINDNLSRALESLSRTEGSDSKRDRDSSTSFGPVDGAETAAAAINSLTEHVKDGRPLSNLEITGGKVPLYGCDDEPLPTFIDLKIPETKEDQIRSYEQYESEEVISSQAVPNVFGSLVCPSHSSGPNDNKTWFKRKSGQSFGDLEFLSNNIDKKRTHRTSKSLDYIPDIPPPSRNAIPSPLRPPPIKDSLSRLSDKPKMMRDISTHVDNQAQAGNQNNIKGWWNVETDEEDGIINGTTPPDKQQQPPFRKKLRAADYGTLMTTPLDDVIGKNKPLTELSPAVDSIAQLPLLSDRQPSMRNIQIDTSVVGFPSSGEVEPLFCSISIYCVDPGTSQLEKQVCGRITESLHFDVVSNAEVAELCKSSLVQNATLGEDEIKDLPPSTTRCGVFSLPIQYDIQHLHAVIIIQKALGDENDLQWYWVGDKTDQELTRRRAKASRVSKVYGKIVTPFAFGVVQLSDILVGNNIESPTSKAAKIPLFKLKPGEGDSPIISHIQAISRQSSYEDDLRTADVINDAFAMLIIRDFGHLGMQNVIDGKSKYSCDRLINFTKEIQTRPRKSSERMKEDNVHSFDETSKSWHSNYIYEAIENGGRNISDSYAQELVSLPLYLRNPDYRLPKHLKLRPQFYTSICNELFLYPLEVQNCSRRNVCVKLEIVRVQKLRIDALKSMIVAIPVPSSIFNSRRGEYLVDEVFSSCSYHKVNPKFMDEMKVKLPLSDLRIEGYGDLAAKFTVYNVFVKSKKGQKSTKTVYDHSSSMQQIGCGLLSLSKGGESSYLLEDNIYNVSIKYKSKPLRFHAGGTERFGLPDDTILIEDLVTSETDPTLSPQKSVASNHPLTPSSTRSNGSRSLSKISSNSSTRTIANIDENITIIVRSLALSSVHAQNETLACFFRKAPPRPVCLKGQNFLGIWKLGKEVMQKEVNVMQSTFKLEDMDSESDLLQLVKQLTLSSTCSQTHLVAHFIRTTFALFRTLVSGNSEPSLAYANPALPIPLRVHSFASILHILTSVTHYLSKSEVKDANCCQKWDQAVICHLFSFLFDEESLFLDSDSNPLEQFDLNKYSNTSNSLKDTVALEGSLLSVDLLEVKDSFDQSDGLISPSFSISPSSSQDDILLKGQKKPVPLRTRSFSAPNKPLKIDTKSDFQFALNMGSSPSSNGSFGPSMMATGRGASRRMRNGGTLLLSTISEDNDQTENDNEDKPPSGLSGEFNNSICLDTEIVLNNKKKSDIKQMRVPNVEQNVDIIARQSSIGSVDSTGNESASQSSMTVPDMDEIESAGTAYLDRIEMDLLNGNARKHVSEARRVGAGHHRKTNSRACSIDWSLPPTDYATENQQQQERISRENSANDLQMIEAAHKSTRNEMSATKDSTTSVPKGNLSTEFNKASCPSKERLCLPSYIERLELQGAKEDQGRWFPYTYEVIIMQWLAFLQAQKAKNGDIPKGLEGFSQTLRTNLMEATQKARGISISCAPVLFVIIRKSLSFRIHSLFKKSKGATYTTGDFSHPPVLLDQEILSALESLITMITDAALDSRNFSSWSFRKTSISVNDSISYFLRDLFALLDSKAVHHLVLTYFARFVSKDGKRWQNTRTHTKIGLNASVEVLKLRLNSITTFIRVIDFVKLNNPLMEAWDWALKLPTRKTRNLFSKAIDELKALGMDQFVDIDRNRKDDLHIPELKPHWLVELVIDICLAASSHQHQDIQLRATALLYELFWASSTFGKEQGSSALVASLYISFIPKLLDHVIYISSLHPKSKFRKDMLPCFVFVLQSAPSGLLRALWRKLCKAAEGKGSTGNYGGIKSVSGGDFSTDSPTSSSTILEEDRTNDESTTDEGVASHTACVLDLCTLLNLSLTTFEYEGSECNMDEKNTSDLLSQWHSEYMPFVEEKEPRRASTSNKSESSVLTSTSSRKWHSHDASTVIISTARNIVREYVSMLHVSTSKKRRSKTVGPIASLSESPLLSQKSTSPKGQKGQLRFSYEDKIIFIRAITSIYLNCLSLRQSDIVLVKTIIACTEILKVFGIEHFLTALGETLEHWMRVILFHCGARRAKVRVEALDFLALILRLQWDSFGSFTRVRIPLLATMNEVIERLVATAAARHYRKQKQSQDSSIHYLSNVQVEAALTPLWRTLTRLHDGSASTNAAFKSALQLLASKMKTLYKSYIAAHALAIVDRVNQSSVLKTHNLGESAFETNRVVMESAEFSKKILGYNQFTNDSEDIIPHYEVMEDAFLAAANVFSTTELPLYRVTWLRKLAEFHASRGRLAEQAACRLQIHNTLKRAAELHESLWNSKPFWPWTKDGVSYNGDYSLGEDENLFDGEKLADEAGLNSSLYGDSNPSFRRIFYRVINSVRMRTGDWDVGGTKTLFCGVTIPSEFTSEEASWIGLRKIESEMVEEAERAGELFLEAGIVESSRYCWGLATQFYSNMFNYSRLARCYEKLAHVVASQVPIIDTSSQIELSSPLGRFYRVHFHGSAAHELTGKEFVYRAPVKVKLDEFSDNIKNVLTSILHEKTDVNIVLDDGRPQDSSRMKGTRRQLGAVPRESINVKVTPLKPLMSLEKCTRGSAEWFYQQTEIADFSFPKAATYVASSMVSKSSSSQGFRQKRGYSTYSSTTLNSFGRPTATHTNNVQHKTFRRINQINSSTIGGEEIGVNKFSFTHPRDRNRGSRDLLKAPNGDVTEKSLRVTELLVSDSMPNCVSRQHVSVENRFVFNQSPLEAGVEAVCSWCAVLFRTAIATNGLAVTKGQESIGTKALRVIMECMHSSKVKEIGLSMLVLQSTPESQSRTIYEKLSPEEVTLNQVKLARALVIFMELLHVLIGRNRDRLLQVSKEKRSHRRDVSTIGSYSGKLGLHYGPPPSPGMSQFTDDYNGTYYDGDTTSRMTGGMDRTDKAMTIQRELQMTFVKLAKALHPAISSIIRNETPKWMRLCCQENYYSSGVYKQTRIAIGEELFFFEDPPGFDSCNESYDNQSSNHLHSSFEEHSIPSILDVRNSDSGMFAGSEGSHSPSRASSIGTEFTK